MATGFENENVEYKTNLEDNLPILRRIKKEFCDNLFDNIQASSLSAFEISGGNFKNPLLIKGKTFKHDFVIVEGNFYSDFIIEKGDFHKSIIIKGGIFYGDLIINSGEFSTDSYYKHNDKDTPDSLSIEGGIFHGNVKINGGNFYGRVIIKGGTFHGNFSVTDGTFYDDFFIVKLPKFESEFKVSDGNFVDRFLISGGSFKQSVEISGGTFEEDLSISKVYFKEDFKISGGKFKKTVRLKQGDYTTVRFEPTMYAPNNYKKNKLPPSYIKQLELDCLISFKVLIGSNNGSPNDFHFINTLTFKQAIQDQSAVYIKKCYIQTLEFDDFWNQGILSIVSLKINSLKPIPKTTSEKILPFFLDFRQRQRKKAQRPEESLLKIQNSKLGAALFSDVPFKDFNRIWISGSTLNNINTVQGYLPQRQVYNYCDKNEDGKIIYHQNFAALAELYNKLYVAMQRQGSRAQEMDYYASFLSYRLRELWAELWKLEVPFLQKRISVIFSLVIHRLTSNYGRSWIIAMFFTFGVAFLFYIPYMESLVLDQSIKDLVPDKEITNADTLRNLIQQGEVTEYIYGFEEDYPQKHSLWEFFKYHLGYYGRFMLVTRDEQEFVKYMDITPLSFLWDVLGRVFVGIGIYQTVTAFRRYGRKTSN